MERIKVGQIGVCHEHAAGKMRTLRLRPDLFEVVGVVDDRATTAAKYPGNDWTPYEGLPWLSEEALFATPGLRAVLVETPNTDLVPAAARCLAQGLPIHMDKPGGENLAPFEALRRGYEARGLPFQMGYMFRHNPAMTWALDAARRGDLGEIFEIHMGMGHDYGCDAYHDYLGHFRGGILFNLVCHLIDWVVALMGRPDRVASCLRATPGLPDHIQNNALAVLEYGRALATLHAASVEADGAPRRRLRVFGTKGTVELCPLERFDGQPLRMDVFLREGNGELASGAHTLDFGVVRDRYEEQLAAFARQVRGEPLDAYDARHDCLVQELLLAASGYDEKRG